VDGVSVGNIADVTVSNWGSADDPRYSFSTTSYEKVGSVHKMTRLMAKRSPEADAARERGETLTPSRSVAGFVEVPQATAVERQIESLFRRR
jgi:hypothetical protein